MRETECGLNVSMIARPSGFAVVHFLSTRRLPSKNYRYQVIAFEENPLFTPAALVDAVIAGWHKVYNDERILRTLGRMQVEKLFCNTLDYKASIREGFGQVRKNGYKDGEPIESSWHKYCLVYKHVEAKNLANDDLHTACSNLAAAINTQALVIDEALGERLQEELASSNIAWDKGVKTLPLKLAVFVQAFSQMPLKRKMTAAETYLKASFI